MAQYEISEQEVQNILIFLNRIEYKGFHEVDAVQRIRLCLSHPASGHDNLEAATEE